VVIENAGSMLNGDLGSAEDGRDHVPTPVPQSTDYVEPASAISKDCEADAVTNGLTHYINAHADDTPFKLRKSRGHNANNQRSGSGSILHRLPAHIPEFLSRNDQQHRVASAPLLDGGHMPVTQPKPAGSLRRAFDKVKGKYGSEKADSDAARRPSSMRRAFENEL
jgi:hypothetical protein